MRLWSLHPSLLDRIGLVALWREGLLAQKVLLGQTSGYRFHPQLERFRQTSSPVAAIGTYLAAVAGAAASRGYRFDMSKISSIEEAVSMPVTEGQLEYERKHLRKKLRARAPEKLRQLSGARITPHPMLRVVTGGIERWEVI
jgi:hypothetical protein